MVLGLLEDNIFGTLQLSTTEKISCLGIKHGHPLARRTREPLVWCSCVQKDFRHNSTYLFLYNYLENSL
jgi:hypothetical protein